MDENKISHCNWSVSDKVESASALHPKASSKGKWSEKDITASGSLVRKEIRKKNSL
jgi:endoglucanase